MHPTHSQVAFSASQSGVIAGWKAIHYRYGKREAALDDFSLQINRGETLALLGPNGAGKSTAVKLLLGLLPTQQGSVHVLGHSPRDTATRAQLGAVLQTQGLPAQLTVLEQLTLQASYYAVAAKPAEVLQQLNLLALQHRRLNQLSGGEKRRLELAMALIARPKLLVLDEPTAGVDIAERARILDLLSALKAQGMSILLTTHLIDEAERLADRVAYLQAGKLCFVGATSTLQQRAGRTRLEFISALSAAQLDAISPKNASISVLPLRPGHWLAEGPDLNELLRGILQQDATARIVSLSPLRLEDALRTLSDSAAAHATAITAQGENNARAA